MGPGAVVYPPVNACWNSAKSARSMAPSSFISPAVRQPVIVPAGQEPGPVIAIGNSSKSSKSTTPLWSISPGTYGSPVIADGRIFIGTNNGGKLRPGIEGDKGVMVCLDEKTGKLLWQMTHDKLPSGRDNDWPEQGIASGPMVDGDRLYYVSNRCELVCADVNGFLDGENDGPYTNEKLHDKPDGDIVWLVDIGNGGKLR